MKGEQGQDMSDAEDTVHLRVIGTEIMNRLRDYCVENGIGAQRATEYLGSVLVQLILSTGVPTPSIDLAKKEAHRIVEQVMFLIPSAEA